PAGWYPRPLALKEGQLVAFQHQAGQSAAQHRPGVNRDAVGLDERLPLGRMPVNDDRAMVSPGRQERFADPDHVVTGLPIQRHAGLDAGMDEQVGTDAMADRQVTQEDQMLEGNTAGPLGWRDRP